MFQKVVIWSFLKVQNEFLLYRTKLSDLKHTRRSYLNIVMDIGMFRVQTERHRIQTEGASMNHRSVNH